MNLLPLPAISISLLLDKNPAIQSPQHPTLLFQRSALIAPQNYDSCVEALDAKVTRKERSKKHYLNNAAPMTKKIAKRTRTDMSCAGSLIVWRISRDVNDDAWKFSFRDQAMAAETTMATTTAPRSKRSRPISKISTAVEDGSEGGVNNKKKKQPECRLPKPKLLEMGVNCDGGLVCPLRKRITCSDINRNQNRLLLPKDALERPLFERMLTPAERAQAAEKNGLAVKVLDQALAREYNLLLKFIPSIQAYRIMGRNYHKLVSESRFRVGRFLDLWLFRVPTAMPSAATDSELKMAVVVEDDGDNKDEKKADEVVEEMQATSEQGGEGEEMTRLPPVQLEVEVGHGCSQAEEEAILGLLTLQYAPPLTE